MSRAWRRIPELLGLEVLLLRSRWQDKLAAVIVTAAPTTYATVKVYLRSRSVGLAAGAGVVCPLTISWILGAWLDQGSWLARTSWARWWANRSNERPLLVAIAGAAVFAGCFALLWLAVAAVTHT